MSSTENDGVRQAAAATTAAPAAAPAAASASDGDVESKAATPAPVASQPSHRALVQEQIKHSKIKVPPKTFAWRDLTVTVQEKQEDGSFTTRTLLNKATGAVAPGEMVAIMGPSGSGKTLLLNSLAGIAMKGLTITGDVLVGGKKPDDTFKQRVSYVQQEDSLMGILTVRETLCFAAKLSGCTDPATQKAMVDDTLQLLGLDVCADVRIGDMFFKGISGGQRRRVSVGVELMKQPSVLVLDEPTSGLDSASAFHVISNLRDLARSGRTVFATIHQPSSEVFALFDKVCIMTRGEMIYFGGADMEAGTSMTEGLVRYLEARGHPCPAFSNVADHALRLVNTDFGTVARDNIEQLKTDFQQHLLPQVNRQVDVMDMQTPHFRKYQDISATFGNTSLCTEFLVLSHRHWLNNLRNPGVFWIRMFMYTMLSIMIGTMFLGMDTEYSTIQDRVSILFYIAAFMVFMSIAVLPFFIQTRAVFARERRNGAYEVGPYVVSQFICSLPGLFLISLISSVIIYFMAGFNDGFDHFVYFLLALFLSLTTAESFMSVVGALVPHYIIGMALGAGAFGMFMLTEGFFIQPDDLPPYWIWGYYLGFHTYSFRAFMVNEFTGIEFEPNPMCGNNVAVSGKEILKQFEMEDSEVWEDLVALIAWTIVYQIVFYVVLKLKYRQRKF